MTKKQLKQNLKLLEQMFDVVSDELVEVRKKLNNANSTVNTQIQYIEKLNKYINALERQLKIQDTAILRKQTIIKYLENGEG